MAGSFDYRLFGLRIHSEIELPELPIERPTTGADVKVRIGTVPPAPGGPGPHAVEGGLLLPIHEVGRFFVRDGAEIVVEPDPGVPEANVRLFLLGSVGAFYHFHQKRWLLASIFGLLVGFSRPNGTDVYLLGPDATILTSQEFLDTHCFGVVADSRNPGMIGLSFAPLRRRDDIVQPREMW